MARREWVRKALIKIDGRNQSEKQLAGGGRVRGGRGGGSEGREGWRVGGAGGAGGCAVLLFFRSFFFPSLLRVATVSVPLVNTATAHLSLDPGVT